MWLAILHPHGREVTATIHYFLCCLLPALPSPGSDEGTKGESFVGI